MQHEFPLLCRTPNQQLPFTSRGEVAVVNMNNGSKPTCGA